MRARSKHPRVNSSFSTPPPPPPPPPPPSSGDLATDKFIDPAVAAPPPSAPDVYSIRRTLDTVLTIQVPHGQLLLDVLTELQTLPVDLASLRQSPPPPPFDDE